jgi:hypothetical protein
MPMPSSGIYSGPSDSPPEHFEGIVLGSGKRGVGLGDGRSSKSSMEQRKRFRETTRARSTPGKASAQVGVSPDSIFLAHGKLSAHKSIFLTWKTE